MSQSSLFGALISVFAIISATAPPSTFKASPAFSCQDPLRNVTALIFANHSDVHSLNTLLHYRLELQDVRRVDLEPINVIPKLCRNAISNLTMLETLSLVLVGIEDIEAGAFSNLPALRQLNLNDNKLQHLQNGVFSGLPIFELYLSGNRIYDIDPGAFDNMSSLQVLDMSFNHVQYVDQFWFKQKPTLHTLNFIFNKIPHLAGDTFEQLNGTRQVLNLWFRNNSISSIHKDAFRGISSMDKLSLAGNKLRFIDDQLFRGVDRIGALDLDHNEISCLSERLLNRTYVQAIYLRGNPIICNCMAKLEQWSVEANTSTYNDFNDLKRCGVKSIFLETTTAPTEGVAVDL